MKVFLSHPSEERDVAERINLALGELGHDVFFDRTDLAAGREYDRTIATAVATSDLFVFLITPDSVTSGRYTLTELKFAQERWPNPDGRVLPVMLRPTDFAAIPTYLRAVNILTPQGDAPAEIAQAVEQLSRSLSLTGRVAKRLRTRTGIAVVAAAVVAVSAFSWLVRPWDYPRRNRAVTLPADVRTHARGVIPLADSGFAIATVNPNRLVRFTDAGVPMGDPADLMGAPVAVSRTPSNVLVVTRGRDGLMVLDAKRLRVADSTILDPSLVKPPPGVANSPRRSGDLQSAAVGPRGELWATTGDRDGEPTILRYHPSDATWDVPTFAVDTAGFGRDALGVTLRDLRGELWGIRARGEPSALYHLVGFIRVDRFDGADLELVRCAHDVAGSPSGNLLLISCDNELQEIAVEARQLTLVHTRATLPAERAPGTSSYDLLVTDSSRVFVALSTVAQPNDTPRRTRVAEVDSAGVVRTLLDVRDAATTSMAVTAKSLVVVLRRADGTADVVVTPRQR